MPGINREYLRSIIFGIEDSLVSTTGLIVGISVGSSNPQLILLAGLVAITIEATSMGASEYLSDDAVQELDKIKRHPDNPLLSGVLMMSSYLLAGLIPLVPIMVLPFPQSIVVGVVLALIGLFLLGYIKGRILHTSPYKGGFKIFFVGGLTALLGIAVGYLFRV